MPFYKRNATMAILAAFILSMIHPGQVEAGTGIYTGFWSGSGFTLSMNTHRYSNASAWWQNLLNSTGKCLVLDGNFGSLTKAATQTWQGDTGYDADGQWQSATTDGVVNSDDFNKMQFSKAPGGYGIPNYYRHQYAGYTDGYATQYWTYYGGGESALLGWNPFAAQQFFNPYRISQAGMTSNWTLIPASANRTISSYPCAA